MVEAGAGEMDKLQIFEALNIVKAEKAVADNGVYVLGITLVGAIVPGVQLQLKA